MRKKKAEIRWLDEPVEHDYEAAEEYLRLLVDEKKARLTAKRLRRAEMTEFSAKDILRASGTSIMYVEAFDWSKHEKELDTGKPLAPILLVRQDSGAPLIIADGFHRLCALFSTDEQIRVPCKIV
ncbi:hypothetical protein [Noviherbaspirillum galbum]|uniref:ParB/Sulfiredoxin domain-containing protein n=1 Tax=Noviherbaspirillum galbum TaxID=2709383 RepID=A0A6B3SUD7_9BURK|nr:hypothetical protein [Noviherbaspirillum galbum]NEX64201.1 hypothetical protein [Noviherbaspirillum galbum]